MKVIDLLNKIANGEKIPKEIKYNGVLYSYNEGIDYVNQYGSFLMGSRVCICPEDLNDEVEIIEEPQEHKIPEKLPNVKFENGKFYLSVGNKHNYIIREVDKVFLNKINEILDYLEKIDNE